jgi:hypothetical protein
MKSLKYNYSELLCLLFNQGAEFFNEIHKYVNKFPFPVQEGWNYSEMEYLTLNQGRSI